MMPSMTRPAPSSKVVLLEDRRGGSDLAAGARVRRFRLARLRFEGAAAPAESRYEYVKPIHD
jgi:hypothetical protein